MESRGQIEGRAVLANNNVYEELKDISVADQGAEDYNFGDNFEEVYEAQLQQLLQKIKHQQDYLLKCNQVLQAACKLDSSEEFVRLMSNRGISKNVMQFGIENPAIDGFPQDVLSDCVEFFYRDSDIFNQMASSVISSLDGAHTSEATDIVGHTLLIDALDPPFSRDPDVRQRPSKSIAGYVDCVIELDEASDFASIRGRKNKEFPETMLDHFIEIWFTKHHNLKCVKTDER